VSISSRIAYCLYSALFYALIPLVLCRLLWRSIKAPAYRQRWLERLAFYPKNHPQDVIWFHAVSVGEAETLFPLIKTLRQNNPSAQLLITTTTPTGSARVKAVLHDTVSHVYLPYDTPGAVKRFMACFKPKFAVIMETEIWPNVFTYCNKHAIPLYLINARISEKSTRGYQKLAALIKPALASAIILSQSQPDTERFIRIGVKPSQVQTLGNMKFDLDNSQATATQGLAIKADLFSERFVWLIASTHAGEEDIFLSLYSAVKHHIPELLLLIVPRHPERFLDVKKLCVQKQLQVVTRSSQQSIHTQTDVFLLDTLGELRTFYATADVAFVGGSMVPVGGHNILEAAAVGVPVMFGPYMANFKSIADSVLALHAAVQCQNNTHLIETVLALYKDPDYRATLAIKGKAFVDANKGICAKILAILPIP
jgi:3-deoxy-D-manno-octulosonic-acid transferase